MIAWYWLIVAFCVGVAFASLTYELFDWINFWTEFVACISLVILFIPIVFYHIFLKNTIHPVEPATFERIIANNDGLSKNWKITNRLYVCFEPKAKKLWNKIFFILLKKTVDK